MEYPRLMKWTKTIATITYHRLIGMEKSKVVLRSVFYRIKSHWTRKVDSFFSLTPIATASVITIYWVFCEQVHRQRQYWPPSLLHWQARRLFHAPVLLSSLRQPLAVVDATLLKWLTQFKKILLLLSFLRQMLNCKLLTFNFLLN